IECLEKALDLEFRKRSETVDLRTVREEYARVLAHCQSLADAMVALKIEPDQKVLVKAVTTADRWRALDPEQADACSAVAAILQRLGQREVGWDYLTTPIA